MSSSYSGNDTAYRYTNAPLPPTKPMMPKDTEVVERLFIVSAPDLIPEHVLCDIFCRFGNLIGAYYVPGRLIFCSLVLIG